MKRVFTLSLILLLLLAACGKQNDATATPSEDIQFTVTRYQLLPPAQSIDDEFEAFYEAFTAAVRSRDLEFIDGILDDEIMTSQSAGRGKEAFHAFWGGYDLWLVLEQIVALGGVFDAEKKNFVAPYTFINFMETGLDVYRHFIVIDEGVHVYTNASTVSRVIDTLDYSILEFRYSDEFWEKRPNDFVGVQTLSGEVGFIQKKHLRAPIDYRLCFAQGDDGWKMVRFIAGE